jgi:myosin-1
LILLFRTKRASLKDNKPVPGGGKPRPAMRPKPTFPKCKALFDYTAQDLDEMDLREGDIVEVHQERKFQIIK